MKKLLFFLMLFHLNSFGCDCEGWKDDIEKLEQLNFYDFIALVRIDSIILGKQTKNRDVENVGEVYFTIKEHFKGEILNMILEDHYTSSCNLGFEINSEWLIYGVKDNNNYHVYPCDRNKKYRDMNGERFEEWNDYKQYSDIRVLRKLFNHQVAKRSDGNYKTFYENGSVESEETVKDNKLHGIRKIYSASGHIYLIENFLNGELEGERTWYYESGQVASLEYRKKGNAIRSIGYADSTTNSEQKEYLLQNHYATKDELAIAFKSFRINSDEYYDSNGVSILERRFYWNGIVSYESFRNQDKSRTYFSYSRDGRLRTAYKITNGKTEIIIEIEESDRKK